MVRAAAITRRVGSIGAHWHVALPAEVVPAEGDGSILVGRVLLKVAVEQRHCPRSSLKPCAPNLHTQIENQHASARGDPGSTKARIIIPEQGSQNNAVIVRQIWAYQGGKLVSK